MTGDRMLIAGIGNIFHGDDAFGVEVAQRLSWRRQPDGVRVVDFGIRGLDLAYALLDGYEVTVLIDATSRGEKPGTLYSIELDLSDLDSLGPDAVEIDTHGMNPMRVFRMVKSLGGESGRVFLVGCEPDTLGPEEGFMGLSESVAAAVYPAVELVESLVQRTFAAREQRAVSIGALR
jgi:hydrogenase maturation protease